MVIEYIRYVVRPERAGEFESAYRRASAALDASVHCLGYELSRGVEEPENWIMRIQWDSVEGHERGFRSGQEFTEFFREVRPFFGDIREMKHYELTGVAGTSA